MKIDETHMMQLLSKSKRVFLLEPPYKRKYVPLGLAKIASFVRQQGGDVRFGRRYDGQPCDLICVTSLFTTDSGLVIETVREARFLAPSTPILIGGVYASLMPKHLEEHTDALVFAGYSTKLDSCVPDYSVDWDIKDVWQDYSFVFTSRGCPNRCPYCAVWRLEPRQWINPTWKAHVLKEKRFAMVSDNNLSSCPEQHIVSVIDFLATEKKRVVFDNGFDCKHITPEMAQELARLKFARTGMRLAFDRIEEDGIFQRAVEVLKEAGVPRSQIMAYVLFNFTDTPKEADYRMRECVKLGIRPYPQMYQPLNKTSRKDVYIGKRWTKRLARAFRFFYLMAGFYAKTTFEEYASGPGQEKCKLTDEDWAMWHQGGEVGT